MINRIINCQLPYPLLGLLLSASLLLPTFLWLTCPIERSFIFPVVSFSMKIMILQFIEITRRLLVIPFCSYQPHRIYSHSTQTQGPFIPKPFHWALCTHRKQINYPSVSHLFKGRCIIFWLALVFLIGFCRLLILLIVFAWSLYPVEVFQRIIRMVAHHVGPFSCQCTQDGVVYRGCLIG